MLETIIVIVAVVIDQVTKHLSDLYLTPLGTSVPVWEGVLHFTSTHNTGAVFGILAGWRYAFLVLTVVAVGVILWVLIKKKAKLHLLARICLALILAGALGNFIDRAFLGYVRDMIEVRFVTFAIFNVADCCVTVGAILFMLDILFGKSKHFFEDGDKKGGPATADGPAIGAEAAAPDTQADAVQQDAGAEENVPDKGGAGPENRAVQ